MGSPAISVAWRAGTGILAAAGLALVLLRVAAPMPVDGLVADQAVFSAAMESLREIQPNGQPIYLAFNDRDPASDDLGHLQAEFPGLSVRPISARTVAGDSCSAKDIAMVRCKADDFIRVSFLSMPLWRTALVRASTSACGTEFTMVQLSQRWATVSRRGLCM